MSISRILSFRFPKCFIIYLRFRSHEIFSTQPLGIGRAALNCRYTWAFNPQGLPDMFVAKHAVRSYRTFSPFPLRHPAGRSVAVVIFCGTFSAFFNEATR